VTPYAPSRELRDYVRSRLDQLVRERVDYQLVERVEYELEHPHRNRRVMGPSSRAEIILAIREWTEINGRKPTWNEWHTSGARPCHDKIRRHFSSWNEAITAAGMEPFQYKRATDKHCANGHRWTDETLYVRPSGKRSCRICGRESRARSEARRREMK